MPPLSLQPMRGRDKEMRAAAIRGQFLGGGVRLVKGKWNAALVQELLSFPSGDHDDQVDALGLIGRRFPMLSAPRADVVPGAYEGAIKQEGNRYLLNIPLETLFQDHEDASRRRNRI